MRKEREVVRKMQEHQKKQRRDKLESQRAALKGETEVKPDEEEREQFEKASSDEESEDNSSSSEGGNDSDGSSSESETSGEVRLRFICFQVNLTVFLSSSCDI
jgi:hypothetical protein